MTTVLKLTSTRPAAIDRLREEKATALVQLAGIVGFALLTAVCAQIRLFVWEVPFSLQTAAIYASGLYLGWRNGLLAQLLYLGAGLVFPVFAGDGFGPAYLFGAASAGYILAGPVAAAVAGLVSRKWNSLAGSTLALVLGAIVIFVVGIIWLHVTAGHTTWYESIDKGFLRFIPVDAAKIMMVSLLYTATRRLA